MGKVLKLFVEELRHCYLTEEHHAFIKYKLASCPVTIVTKFEVLIMLEDLIFYLSLVTLSLVRYTELIISFK